MIEAPQKHVHMSVAIFLGRRDNMDLKSYMWNRHKYELILHWNFYGLITIIITNWSRFYNSKYYIFVLCEQIVWKILAYSASHEFIKDSIIFVNIHSYVV